MLMHIVEETNPVNNHLVTLSRDLLPQTPGISSVRAKTRVISLTTNNVTYTKSNLLGWWHAYPLPHSISLGSSGERYIHAPGWGYAEVLESNLNLLPKGSWLFGYFPFSTFPFDLSLAPSDLEGHFKEVSEHRRALVDFYNRYEILPVDQLYAANSEGNLSWSTLMRALFGTGFDLANFALSWIPEERVHPAGPDSSYQWDCNTDGNIKGAVVFVLAAVGKAALTFAHQLKDGRPESQRPKAVVAVSSQPSWKVAQQCGFYDAVYGYDEAERARTEVLAAQPATKVLVVDFRSRNITERSWVDTLQTSVSQPITHLCIATLPPLGSNGVLALAPHITLAAIDLVGEKTYYSKIALAFRNFSEHQKVIGVELVCKHGLEEFKEDFDAIIAGKFDSSKGLVYWI